MILGIYAIRDEKTGFLTPTVEQNDASAVRNFAHACKNADSLFFTHPFDYSIYSIGSYDTKTGILIPHEFIKELALASDFVLHEDLRKEK